MPKTENKLAIIGIDSLDPYVILKYREMLPNLSRLVDESPTLTAKSIFPVDTVPAWVSIYTGLFPVNHGLLYVYDVYDQDFGDLAKLDTSSVKGKTFWDYAGEAGYRTTVLFPTLMYPAWETNGIMISKSPFEKRLDWLRTTRDVSVCPQSAQERYQIPKELEDLWGGHPGRRHLMDWANIGKQALEREKRIALKLFERAQWDLFFVIFALLDIIQHRLWRFFDESDPTYPGPTDYRNIILEYYQIFDELIGDFAEACSDRTLLVVSDHGHRVRPTKTINVNECLRRRGYLVAQGKSGGLRNQLRKILLEAATRLNIEHTLIKLVVSSKKVTKISKSLYSSSGSIDLGGSVAYLSTFAGIKSYSHGGIEINRELVSDTECARLTAELETLLLQLTTPQGDRAVTCLKRRDELEGDHAEAIYPDLLFELREDFGVGWEVRSGLFGKAYDHNVASGGHGKTATFLIRGARTETVRGNLSIVDIAPTILDLLGIDWRHFGFDGRSIFG